MVSNGIQGKVVVITGASSGFGKGLARKFAEHGVHVVLAARREALLSALAEECESAGVRALAVPTDVSKRDDVENLGEQARSSFGRIDVWINNAGVGALGRFDQVPIEDHIRVIETNLHGVIYGSHVALRQYWTQGYGTLINIASGLGKMPAPYFNSYVASKHGVVGLDGALRQELRENDAEDIHVCTVLPNSNDTPFFDHVANYTGHEPTPIPPLYDPQEVIDTVFDLLEHPKDEVIVGGMGKVMVGMHEVAPGLQERMAGKQVHQEQMEKAEHAAVTTGSLYEPQGVGSDVYGGRLEK